MYALLAVKIGQQFSWVTDAWKGIVKFAAVTQGATVAETIAAAATRAWGLAMTALPWVALAAAVVAVAVLIIKYHTQIWAFIQRVWHDILAVIMAAWNWVKSNWPLLVGIITGPIGLAILWVVQHFGQITTAVRTVLNAVRTAWDATWGAIRTAFAVFIHAGIITPFGTITGAIRTVLSAVSAAWNSTWNTLKGAFRVFVVDGILGPLGLIVNGAAKAFGWVPGLGGKLKSAAAAFNTFRASVNSALGGINGRTVSVSVAMTSKTNPYPGGISGRAAAGMYVSRGRPGVDDQLILAQRGELVVPTRLVRAGAVDHLRGKIPGFAAGGQVGAPGTGVNVAPHTPTAAQITSALMASVTKLAQAFAKSAAAAVGGGGMVSYKAGAGVAQWAGVILRALAMLGQSPGWLGTVERRMNQESGGNPNIVNKWDCLTLDYGILTRRGWLRHDEVRPGDETTGWDPQTQRGKWTRITRVVRYDDAEVWRIGTGDWHADATPNHRWLLAGGGFARTDELTPDTKIRLGADRLEAGITVRSVRRAPVWCVTTELGTWTTRGGDATPFLTGNSNWLAGHPSVGLLPHAGHRGHVPVVRRAFPRHRAVLLRGVGRPAGQHLRGAELRDPQLRVTVRAEPAGRLRLRRAADARLDDGVQRDRPARDGPAPRRPGRAPCRDTGAARGSPAADRRRRRDPRRDRPPRRRRHQQRGRRRVIPAALSTRRSLE
jgi:hypothetical protein